MSSLLSSPEIPKLTASRGHTIIKFNIQVKDGRRNRRSKDSSGTSLSYIQWKPFLPHKMRFKGAYTSAIMKQVIRVPLKIC